jgi:hypothetical protein
MAEQGTVKCLTTPKAIGRVLSHDEGFYAVHPYCAIRLYKIVFAATYWSDLNELGLERVATLLQLVQKRRNEFAHGQPAAIDDGLINDLVATLKDEHEAWIAVFNRRVNQVGAHV